MSQVTISRQEAGWPKSLFLSLMLIGKWKESAFAYRLYYQTTHWVVQLQYDSAGEPWYTVIEDKWDLAYYVPARHLRLIPEMELKPISGRIA